MISESDRYQGLVLREIIVSCGERVSVKVVNVSGRVDAFAVDGAAFQIKHSGKRLSPWQFTYFPDNLDELAELQSRFNCVWAFLVCGQDGIVGLSITELLSIVQLGAGGAAWVRVRRSRNSMYRVAGTFGLNLSASAKNPWTPLAFARSSSPRVPATRYIELRLRRTRTHAAPPAPNCTMERSSVIDSPTMPSCPHTRKAHTQLNRLCNSASSSRLSGK